MKHRRLHHPEVLVPAGASRQRVAPVLAVAFAAVLAAGCTSLAPPYERPAAPVPAQLPVQPVNAEPGAAPAAPAEVQPLDWRAFVLPPELKQLVERALAHNRDLRVAVLNVDRARAQLGVTRADRYPTVGVGVTGTRAPNPANGQETNTFTAGLQVNAWELDFFGRLASLSAAAQAQLLATEAGRRSAELSVVSAVLASALAHAADTDLADLAQRTLATRQDTLRLTRAKFDAGATSQLELQQADTLVAQARAALAQAQRQRAQDLNALSLLVGEPVSPDALAALGHLAPTAVAGEAAGSGSGAAAPATWLADVPVGLDSRVLLRRPDVTQAEQQLIAANANIGAARAAFFPRVSLTAQAGLASTSFSNLFEAGSLAWTVAPQAVLSIFDFGRNQANLDATKASRDIAVAQYERAIQSAFRDTADALAGLATWREQLDAQAQLLNSTREVARLTQLRYDNGAASELERLDAQRNLFAAEQGLIQTRLAELQNRIALFKALGG